MSTSAVQTPVKMVEHVQMRWINTLAVVHQDTGVKIVKQVIIKLNI